MKDSVCSADLSVGIPSPKNVVAAFRANSDNNSIAFRENPLHSTLLFDSYSFDAEMLVMTQIIFNSLLNDRIQIVFLDIITK